MDYQGTAWYMTRLMVAKDDRFTSMHVRVETHNVARIDEYAVTLGARAKVSVSRSAALRRIIELGLHEAMRERSKAVDR